MKYHGHIIKKVPEDLGEEDPRHNLLYYIYKDGKYIQVAVNLMSAKDYIDSNYDENVL